MNERAATRRVGILCSAEESRNDLPAGLTSREVFDLSGLIDSAQVSVHLIQVSLESPN